MKLHVSLQTAPASSLWSQLSMELNLQSSSRLSIPVQRTSSRWMLPVPLPNLALPWAMASKENKQQKQQDPIMFHHCKPQYCRETFFFTMQTQINNREFRQLKKMPQSTNVSVKNFNIKILNIIPHGVEEIVF